MKKSVIIFLILTLSFELLTFNCSAQLNGGFEDWHTESNYQVPDDWQTLNFLSLFSPPNPLSAFKATGVDKHSGSFALKLKTVYLNNNPAPGVINDTIGYAFKGKVTISPPTLKYGFAYTGRPEKLEFWAKCFPVGIDSGGALAVLTKWNGTFSDTIAYGELAIAETPSYSPFQVNLVYQSSLIPDTAIIGFASSGRIKKSREGSIIFIDDVAFTGWVGIEQPKMSGADQVQLFPNPAKEDITIIAEIDKADHVLVIDNSGRRLNSYKIYNCSLNINTSMYAEGIYFYEIRDKKNEILAKGKFDVIK